MRWLQLLSEVLDIEIGVALAFERAQLLDRGPPDIFNAPYTGSYVELTNALLLEYAPYRREVQERVLAPH